MDEENLLQIIAEQAAQGVAITLLLRALAADDKRRGIDPASHAETWLDVAHDALDQTAFAVAPENVELVREIAKARVDEIITNGLG